MTITEYTKGYILLWVFHLVSALPYFFSRHVTFKMKKRTAFSVLLSDRLREALLSILSRSYADL